MVLVKTNPEQSVNTGDIHKRADVVSRKTDGLTVVGAHNNRADLALVITKCLLPRQMQAKP